MTADNIRKMMSEKFEVISAREWCTVMDVRPSHLNEFLRGKRATPPSDLLEALNLRIDYVRKKRTRA